MEELPIITTSLGRDTTLNEQQLKAATFTGKHLLVLAGAGTGKTKTIIERAKFLIANGADPERIVILSFTRKSANEIISRIKSSITIPIGKELIGQTFHSWCMGLIKNNPQIFAQHDCLILDEEDRNNAFKLLADKDFKKKTSAPTTAIGEVYSYAINTRCSLSDAIGAKIFEGELPPFAPQTLKSIEIMRPFFQEAIKSYITYKAEHRYIDYDDILNIVAKGLKGNEQAREFITSQFDHILIDEMQDTNPLQYELLANFFDKCHLFCVGDDAQSIYAFRGADFKTIHSFTKLVPDSEVCKLTLNYRSTQEILDLSNWLLETSSLDYNKKLTANRGKGAKPQIINWYTDNDEANDVISKIKKSITEEGEDYSDNLVLSRSAWGLRRIEAKLIESKIPYIIFGGMSLMKSKHIRDVVAVLRIVANHRDELAWTRFLQLWKGIGPVSCQRILNKVLFTDNITQSLDALKSCKIQEEIYKTLYAVNECKDDISKALDKALKHMQTLLADIYGKEWDYRQKDFAIIKEVAQNSKTISDFVNDYILDPKLETTIKNNNDYSNCVVLSTIHSAKGLEAKNCYILNVSVGNYPNARSINNGDGAIEEERRCLYVALTRAKDRLYIYRDFRSVKAAYNNYDLESQLYFLLDLPKKLATSSTITSPQFGRGSYFDAKVDFSDSDMGFDFN